MTDHHAARQQDSIAFRWTKNRIVEMLGVELAYPYFRLPIVRLPGAVVFRGYRLTCRWGCRFTAKCEVSVIGVRGRGSV